MFQELLKAFTLIFVAEMGDKTQILAMAFATKFPVKKVLMGILIGSFLNHGLAVLLGSYISNFIPTDTIQVVAGMAFVAFSLWTLKSDDGEEEEEKSKFSFGPTATVAAAFFIGELGDKTQLTAITLATSALYPIAILGGTVLGMVVTGGIGIIIGKKLGDKIPELAIKLIAALVFMFFGLTKLYQNLPQQYLSLQNITIFIAVIAILAFILVRSLIAKTREGKQSVFKRKSKELYEYYNKAKARMDKVCLGEQYCGQCQGNNCIVGYTKTLIKQGLDRDGEFSKEKFNPKMETLYKHYDREQLMESLRITLEIIKQDPNNAEYENIHAIRRNVEMILFGKSLRKINDWSEYIKWLTAVDKEVAISVLKDSKE